MGDVPIIVGCLIGFAVVFDVILIFLLVKTETTPRPDLEEGGGKE